MLDGKDICSLYEIKPGKALKFIIEEQIKYQIIHPDSKYEDVQNYLKEKKEQFLA